jgi:hypothetical protein
VSEVPAVARDEQQGRNRVVLRVLLMIMAALVVASLLVGVRW